MKTIGGLLLCCMLAGCLSATTGQYTYTSYPKHGYKFHAESGEAQNQGTDPSNPSDQTNPVDPSAPTDPTDPFVPSDILVDQETIEQINNFEKQHFVYTYSDFERNENGDVVSFKSQDDYSGKEYNQINLGGNSVGLKYSDFGYLSYWGDSYSDGRHYLLFNTEKNGYNQIPEENIEFTGRAYATLTKFADNSEEAIVSGNAKLMVNPEQQKETLKVNFDNWYDMTITKEKNVADATFIPSKNFQDNGFDFTGEFENTSLVSKYYGDGKVEETSGEFFIEKNISDREYYELEGVFGARRMP